MADAWKRAWTKSTRIKVVLALNLTVFVVELVAGFLTHSLALTADAFHLFNDMISLVVGLWAVEVAKREATDDFSFGWARVEVLGAFFNAVFLMAFCVSIFIKTLIHFFQPPDIEDPKLLLVVGCVGLLSNLLSASVLGGHGHHHSHGCHGPSDLEEAVASGNDSTIRLAKHDANATLQPADFECDSDAKAFLNKDWHSDSFSLRQSGQDEPSQAPGHVNHHHGDDLGMKALLLHVLGDALGNLGVIVTALVVWLTEWKGKAYADPTVSLLITTILLKTTIPLIRDSARILLQAAPEAVKVAEIRRAIETVPGVVECHRIQVWQLTGSKVVASLQVSVATSVVEEYHKVAEMIMYCLNGYGIQDTTIEPRFCHSRKGQSCLGVELSEQNDVCCSSD
ncbi:hypothetical protein HIM_08125 [Hirsutella minnesotensis 3608]|uniref:Zinc/cadmium resistance protein n=1 Tax=Hirsutella minnesotensis 3608 TaxID=1043627 RepID=A0A0F7ZHD6_9HYPO|nr:hypothetical protein HIM_08125 [Hirsutella minnesotensis 3608]